GETAGDGRGCSRSRSRDRGGFSSGGRGKRLFRQSRRATGHHRSLRGANSGVHPAAEADPARQELRGGHGDRSCYRRRGAGRRRRGRVDSHPVCAHVFRHR
ncbi:unnamed protein product, partial [Ectocarpus sp. 13 AM-2016]